MEIRKCTKENPIPEFDIWVDHPDLEHIDRIEFYNIYKCPNCQIVIEEEI